MPPGVTAGLVQYKEDLAEEATRLMEIGYPEDLAYREAKERVLVWYRRRNVPSNISG